MDWTEVLAAEAENKRERLAAELLASNAHANTAERVKAFVEQGGGCRATFFNYRRYLAPATGRHRPPCPLFGLGLGRLGPDPHLHELCRQHGELLQGPDPRHVAGPASGRAEPGRRAFPYLGWPKPGFPVQPNPIAPLNPGSIRPATLASVTDGLSNTFAFGEKAHGKFSQDPDVYFSVHFLQRRWSRAISATRSSPRSSR